MIQESNTGVVCRRYSKGIVTGTDVSIIIPALNEEATIRAVVDRCLALPLEVQVIVVNDGSQDKTLEILQTYGDQITLITNAKPRRGASLW